VARSPEREACSSRRQKPMNTAVRHIGDGRMMPKRPRADTRWTDEPRSPGCLRRGSRRESQRWCEYTHRGSTVIRRVLPRACWIRSTIAPSLLDWNVSTFMSSSRPSLLELLVDIGESGMTINFGFAFSEQVEVGSMHDEHCDRIASALFTTQTCRLRGQPLSSQSSHPARAPSCCPYRHSTAPVIRLQACQ